MILNETFSNMDKDEIEKMENQDNILDSNIFDRMEREKTPQKKFDILLQFHNHLSVNMNADDLIPFIINHIVICKPRNFVSNVR